MSETVTAALSSAAGFPLVRMIASSGGLPMGCARASSTALRGSAMNGISFIDRMVQFGGTRTSEVLPPVFDGDLLPVRGVDLLERAA